jgi:predicted amidohydrolase
LGQAGDAENAITSIGVKLAAIQYKPPKGNTTKALEGLYSLIAEAGRGGARLVVCPEMAHTGYLFRNAGEIRSYAEPALGGSFPELAALAIRFRLYLVCGYVETSDDGALFNAARIIDSKGKLAVNYRKRLLYDSDHAWAAAGDCSYICSGEAQPYPVLSTAVGRLAIGICMDLNDDRFTAFLRRTQPDLIALPVNWIDEGHDVRPYWQWRLRGVNSVLIAANTYGCEHCEPHPRTRFLGRSAILRLQRRSDGRVPTDVLPETLAIAPSEGDAVIFAEQAFKEPRD